LLPVDERPAFVVLLPPPCVAGSDTAQV